MMAPAPAPALKRKGIAIPNRPPAKRRKSVSKRGRSSRSDLERQLPPGYSNDEWPLKRILEEEGERYLVDWADNPQTGETFAPDWVGDL